MAKSVTRETTATDGIIPIYRPGLAQDMGSEISGRVAYRRCDPRLKAH